MNTQIMNGQVEWANAVGNFFAVNGYAKRKNRKVQTNPILKQIWPQGGKDTVYKKCDKAIKESSPYSGVITREQFLFYEMRTTAKPVPQGQTNTQVADTITKENLKFIADALGGKGTPCDVIHSYFLNDYYADHCKTYQKHPIYWLFDSGKKNGFMVLSYLHRYQPDTIAELRAYEEKIHHLADQMSSIDLDDGVKVNYAKF